MRRRSGLGVVAQPQFLLHPSMILELFSVVLASLLLHLAIASSNAPSKTICAPARCGDLTISYPFSLGGVQSFEYGLPSFNLTCDPDGRAYLSRTFRDHLYRVQEIFYYNNSLVVAMDTAFSGGDERCPVPDFNISSSLSLFPLIISGKNKEITFVCNCEVPPTMKLPQTCANRSIGAYFSEDTEARRATTNCSSVSVPVRAFQEKRQARDYVPMISDGFLLEWPALEDCDACMRRGGKCRFVQLSIQCLCDGQPCPTSRRNDKRKKQSTKIILIVSLSAATSLILTSIVWIMYRRREKQTLFIQKYTSNESNIEKMLKGYDSLTVKRYRYSELWKITGSFKKKLGEGGYGVVFKGNLEDGRTVAVKILKGSKGNGEEFLNEVVSIRRTSHVNVVNLLGFCLHGSKRALIYEYMANGSMDKYIYSEESKMAIGWEKLKQIAIGIARGLEYLHRGCNTRIIHFDIKPHNVLLDQDFCPKIADFGLAKPCHLKDSALSIF